MKALFFLFIILITYSHSVNVKYVQIGEYLTTLDSTLNYGYFYFRINDYSSGDYLYLYLFDKNYNLYSPISYCLTDTSPSQAIGSCNFISKYNDDYDTPGLYKGYYYKISLDRSYYLIIRYTGSYQWGTIKARGSYYNFIEKISIDASSDKSLTRFDEIYNYFYAYIDYTKHDYLYFYFDDPADVLKDPIYYCITFNEPDISSSTLRNCYFKTLSYDEKKPTSYYDYSYKIDISGNRETYVIVRYSVSSPYHALYVKGLYKSKSISTLAIVFIVIAGVAFVSIIITILCYCCKRRTPNNINYVETQPAVVVPEQPALVVQTPSYPLVEQGNIYPTY